MKSRQHFNVHCSSCQVRKLCLNNNLEPEELEILNHVFSGMKLVKKGEHLYLANEKIKWLYAIFDGLAKEYQLDEEGNEFINDFYFPGDILGMDLVHTDTTQYHLVALKDTLVCVMELKTFLTYMDTYPFFQKRIIELLCKRIQGHKKFHLTTDAKARVAIMLLHIVERMNERYPGQTMIKMPIAQVEMSQRLGMANETLNRILKLFSQEKILTMSKNTITFCNQEALRRIAKL